MKTLNESYATYGSPAVEVIDIDTADILCASSGDLDELTKNSYDFDWEN